MLEGTMPAPAFASAVVLAASVSLSIGSTAPVSLLGVLACCHGTGGLCICAVCVNRVDLPCSLVSVLVGEAANCSGMLSARLALFAERPVSAACGALSFVAGEAIDSFPAVEVAEDRGGC